ncbi:MAG: DUF5011 domain-containing protein [Bacilli bacterium]
MTKNINGFTLIEIMGILVLLSIISMITMTIVTDSVRNSKKTITETQQINIKKAANDWALNNSDNLPIKENESINITLGALKQNGYIDAYIKDPKSQKALLNCQYINIKRSNKNYVYTILNPREDCTKENDPFAPNIVLKGELEMTVNLNEEFIDPGIIAHNSVGSLIKEINKTITKNNQTVINVDTSIKGIYQITYTVSDNGTPVSVKRMVNVKDTTPPVITVNNSTVRSNISIVKGNIFTVPVATAFDNYDGDISNKIIVTSNVNPNIIGTYDILYTVSDSEFNIRSLTVTVNVT